MGASQVCIEFNDGQGSDTCLKCPAIGERVPYEPTPHTDTGGTHVEYSYTREKTIGVVGVAQSEDYKTYLYRRILEKRVKALTDTEIAVLIFGKVHGWPVRRICRILKTHRRAVIKILEDFSE
jgi:hypothetical protein